MLTGRENFDEHSRISDWLVVKEMWCPKIHGIINTLARIYGQHHENICPGKCFHSSTKLRLPGMQARPVWAHFLLRCILPSVKFSGTCDLVIKIIIKAGLLQSVQRFIHVFPAFAKEIGIDAYKKKMEGYYDKFKDQKKINSLFQTDNKQTSFRCRRESRKKPLATQRTWGRVVLWVGRVLTVLMKSRPEGLLLFCVSWGLTT